MKKIILFLIISLSFINCSALNYKGCDYSVVANMKSMINNVNISYNYKIIDNSAYFDITINNLTNDIYFYDRVSDRNYFYSDTNNGEITLYNFRSGTGNFKFYSNVGDCFGISLGSKYYKLPTYNIYYGHELCKNIPNYSLCKKWGYVGYSEEEFKQYVLDYINGNNTQDEEKTIVEYEKSFFDKIVDVYINYYYYFFITLILMCVIIAIIYNKKNKFDL